jgi:hypothetical protein
MACKPGEVLSLLALLVYKYEYNLMLNKNVYALQTGGGTQFTWFTGIQIQILTPEERSTVHIADLSPGGSERVQLILHSDPAKVI